ncbi:Serine/threonine-protein kinase VPS15 (Vacuolar protein sorting-associated protein 15) (AtVPS15) [Durusdinium trenchii]|uniref:non-specific serine/threonine protein kinase n=1 Tax=Durusdinium trenchii TaxID=1381693 RepID=A0ABP0QVY8_9DINO
MGNIVPTGRAGGNVQSLLGDLDQGRFKFEETLWNGKFIKSVKCHAGGNLVVVKVYEKIPGATDAAVLKSLRRRLEEIRDAFHPKLHPNVLPYNRWGESANGAYLIRQYTSSNLYDRQNTRPFLSPMEKRWIAFQLLKAVSQCHNAGVAHGDIKAENVLVTSWNWVMLCDFAPFKPTFLPLDDTAPYHYFFATNSKRDCCTLAPERFCSPTSIIDISLLDSAPPQCSSFLSVMMDSSVPAIDADHALGESVTALEEATMASARRADGTTAGDGAGNGEARAPASTSSASQASTSGRVSPTTPGGRKQRSYSFSSHTRSTRLRPSMDIFSLGCVIMEVFQDGEPCLNLAETLKYAKRNAGDDSAIEKKVAKLQHPDVRLLVEHMLADDPSKRLSADQYLERHTGPGKLFPAFFSDMLHPFMADMLLPEYDLPDERIWAVCKDYDSIVSQICGVHDVRGAAYFERRFKEWSERTVTNLDSNEVREMLRREPSSTTTGAAPRVDASKGSGSDLPRTDSSLSSGTPEAEAVASLLQRTRKILDDMAGLRNSSGVRDMIAEASANVSAQIAKASGDAAAGQRQRHPPPAPPGFGRGARSPGMDRDDFILSTSRGGDASDLDDAELDTEEDVFVEDRPEDENAVIIIISLVYSTMRHVRYPSTKVIALRLLQRLSRFSHDETRLQRIVPFVVSLLNDSSSLVRCTAIRVITSIVAMIRQVPTSDQRIFPDFILPALVRFKKDSSLNARLAFAECLPRLAEASARFLEISRLNHVERLLSTSTAVADSGPRETSSSSSASSLGLTVQTTSGTGPGALRDSADPGLGRLNQQYDAQLDELRNLVEEFVRDMIEQPAVVHRTLLCDMTRLCLFFGRERTSGHVLPILITFLNVRDDWQLKASFFEHIPGVGALVGPLAIQHFLLPGIFESLQDAEELVVQRTLSSLYALIELGLLDTNMMSEITAKVAPLVFHPGIFVRCAVVRLLAALVSSKRLGMVEIQVTLVRIIKPFLKPDCMSGALMLGFSKDIDDNQELLEDLLQPPLSRAVFEAAVAAREDKGAGAQKSKRRTSRGRPASSQHALAAELKLPKSREYQQQHEQQGDADAGTTPIVDLGALDKATKHKIALLEDYIASCANSRRCDRAKTYDPVTELPAEYRGILSTKEQFYSVTVPDQSYITLAVHSKYAEYLELTRSSMAGVASAKQNPLFTELVNRYGVVSMLRRHGNHGPMTSEALSAGENRLLRRIRALDVPPLPPDMGALRKLDGTRFVAKVRRPSSKLGSALVDESSTTRDAANMPNEKPWRPRGVLAANLYGHDGAVNRIAASQDSLFFATGSDDGTVRLWLTEGIDDGYGIRPRLTYASQGGCITDVCMVENTHSVASVSTNGSVHVFRVEHALDATRQALDPSTTLLSQKATTAEEREDQLLDRSNSRMMKQRQQQQQQQRLEQHQLMEGDGAKDGVNDHQATVSSSSSQQQRNLASTTVLELDVHEEGGIRAVCHFPSAAQSFLTFASESGSIHGWDLRGRDRSWALRVGPQAGMITALVAPPEGDVLWLVAGTSRGLVILYDLRFEIVLRAWRHPSHSKIHRLCISRATGCDPLVYIAAGENAFGLYNIADGKHVQSFKTVPTAMDAETAAVVAELEPVDVDLLAPLSGSRPHALSSKAMPAGSELLDTLATDGLDPARRRIEPSVRAILCPFDTVDAKDHKAHIPNTVISAGSDRRIRYWHSDCSLCYSIFDQEFGVPPTQHWDELPHTLVCREDVLEDGFSSANHPNNEGRGLAHPSSNHDDAVLDMAFVQAHSAFQSGSGIKNPGFLLSASRDGVVKAWV